MSCQRLLTESSIWGKIISLILLNLIRLKRNKENSSSHSNIAENSQKLSIFDLHLELCLVNGCPLNPQQGDRLSRRIYIKITFIFKTITKTECPFTPKLPAKAMNPKKLLFNPEKHSKGPLIENVRGTLRKSKWVNSLLGSLALPAAKNIYNRVYFG